MRKINLLISLFFVGTFQGVICGEHIPWISNIITKGMLNHVPRGTEDVSLCTQHGRILTEHAANLTTWAIRMLDASSKGPNGLIHGNNHDFGHYDQCLTTEVPFLNVTGRFMIINMKYRRKENEMMCEESGGNKYPGELDSAWNFVKENPDWRRRQRNEINWAICVPSSCEPVDIEFSINQALKPLLEQQNIEANISVVHYQDKTGIQFNLAFLVFLFVVSIIVILVVLATFIEYFLFNEFNKVNQHSLVKYLLYFSIQSNMTELMDPKSQEFSVISGMKVLSMFLIIFGHRLLVTAASPIFNTHDNEVAIGKFVNTILYNGTVVVNTFLVITGFLSYNKILKDVNNGRSINIFKMIARRWLRLTPVYVFCLGLIILVIPKLEEGPLAFDQLWNNTACAERWWTHVLYLNNYIHPETQCTLPSWYLAVDMQMYIICSFVGYITWKNKHYGKMCLFFLLIASIIIPGVITFFNHYDGATLIYLKDLKILYNEKQFIETYMPAHTRATPYFIGMIGAIIYNDLKVTKSFNFPKCILLIITLLMLIAMLFTILGAWILYGNIYNVLQHTIYSATHRVTWSIPISWLIIIYSSNKLSVFRGLLGSKIYHPFNQMSFCVLLIHNPLQLYLAGALRYPVFYDSVTMIWMACGDIVISYFAAFLLYLFIEVPFTHLLIKNG